MTFEPSWRKRLETVIFGTDTPAGKMFDIVLLWAIILSVIVVLLESVTPFRMEHGIWFHRAEWLFTILFTVEYTLRLIASRHTRRYVTSFFGIVDLLAILPTYLSFFFPGAQTLIVVRILRLLRVFRILKLARYLGEADLLLRALKASRIKITVFLVGVLTLITIAGTLMYLIEGEASGFSSIPRSMYWAIVTMTTVGYGDIAPQTVLGQMLASVIMIMGYAIIAVPTGIVSVEIVEAVRRTPSGEIEHKRLRTCTHCGAVGHPPEARFCWRCGNIIRKEEKR